LQSTPFPPLGQVSSNVVPPGKTFEETCPRGGKGVDCKSIHQLEGQVCGGFTGVACHPGLTCSYDDDHPDVQGVCVK